MSSNERLAPEEQTEKALSNRARQIPSLQYYRSQGTPLELITLDLHYPL